MKSIMFPAILAVLILAGCSSTKDVADYDDVYYSTRADKKQKKAQELQTADPDYYIQSEDPETDYYMEDYKAGEYVSYEEEPAYSESEVVENPDGTTYITNNYYGSAGYYDYPYSARINRFYNPYYGFGYYSPWNVGFFYDPWYDPFWYGPSFYFGMNWGWGGMGWGYPGWGYPGWGYPGWGYPYNSYWYGYNHGFWDGYYASGEYGSSGSYYYGPRTSHSGGSYSPYSRAGNSGYTAQASKSGPVDRNRPLMSSGLVAVPAQQNASAAGSRTDNATVVNNSRNGQGSNQLDSKSKTTTDKPRYIYNKPDARTTGANDRYATGNSGSTRNETQPVRRYTKPESVSNDRNVTRPGNTNASTRQQSVYSRPESNSNPLYTRPSQQTDTRRYTQPSSTRNNSYTQPSRTNTRSYSQPSRSSVEYQRPSNNYNNSRSSYSRPSSSGGNRSSSGIRSTSSPSRSSGGGGRSSSSSRSSGGGRR